MLTWKTIDRSDFKYEIPADEPDKAQWVAHGLDCLIVRGPHGALCGYVGVPPAHPQYEVDYNSVVTSDNEYLEAHGGLTFSDRCQPTDDPAKHICHMHEFAANPTVWWLGFDCAHSGDITPQYSAGYAFESYKTFSYVQREVEGLAAQLAAMTQPQA